MLRDDSRIELATAGPFTATAFREDGSAQLVAITALEFDHCRISSTSRLAVGERLRLHLKGQGWIEAEVRSLSADGASVVFVTKCRC